MFMKIKGRFLESHDVYENKAGYRRKATMFMKQRLLSSRRGSQGNQTPHPTRP
jgi:hypothetical protein